MLENGNKKSARETLDDRLESLKEIYKLREQSAAEDLVNDRTRLEMHDITVFKYFPETSTEEGYVSSTTGPLIKNGKITTKVRMKV